MEAFSSKPVAEGVEYLNNPFSATFYVDDSSSTVPITISVWDYDGGWTEDEQYDCGSLSGTGSGLLFTTLYDVSQESMIYESDGTVDGGSVGPQAKIVVEIITLRN